MKKFLGLLLILGGLFLATATVFPLFTMAPEDWLVALFMLHLLPIGLIIALVGWRLFQNEPKPDDKLRLILWGTLGAIMTITGLLAFNSMFTISPLSALVLALPWLISGLVVSTWALKSYWRAKRQQ